MGDVQGEDFSAHEKALRVDYLRKVLRRVGAYQKGAWKSVKGVAVFVGFLTVCNFVLQRVGFEILVGYEIFAHLGCHKVSKIVTDRQWVYWQ